jgi:biopolymer transport protein ExbD
MRLNKSLHRKKMEINMTPMIDVVFQLLIFFMTCSQVSEANRDPLELPVLPGSTDSAQEDVIINISAAGEMRIGGEAVSILQIVNQCTSVAKASPAGDVTAITVVIRADRRVIARPVNEIVSALTKLGITRVRIAVQTE